jgi:UDP-N-acetylmuramoyl-L-alanyl-D-glutamate--2,6-diaminopimelate ligase
MKLRLLLASLSPELAAQPLQGNHPALDQSVKRICTNSHACQPGDLFIGMPGTRVDGGEFWQGAIASGAIAAVISPAALAARPQPAEDESCLITSESLPLACATLAAAFYDRPAEKLALAGVTGTNGKTTTTHLIEHFLIAGLKQTALFGTLYSRWTGHQRTAAHTTPFAVDLQEELASAVLADCTHGVMEVSSHALAQQRIWGCPFEVAVFTNLTQDHLDFHPSLEDYFAAKALLFSPDYLKGRAIINQQDPYGQRLIQQLDPKQVWTYSIDDSSADLWMSALAYKATGVSGILHTPKGQKGFTSPLIGQFNLENLLAAVGAALHLDISLDEILGALPQFPGVPGRMERVQVDSSQDITVLVDYAHTPDSLDNALQAARPFVPGRLICVFGCGGDRDRTKRPLMGRIAQQQSDYVIVTSDNPRTEDPQQIVQDVLAGIAVPLPPDQVIVDRADAIAAAIALAEPGDGILIAGKGHEDYQILGTEKVHFDDREQARAALCNRYDIPQIGT